MPNDTARHQLRRSSRKAVRTALALAALLVASDVLAHGAWFKNGVLSYAATTKTLLQNNVNAGIPGFANGDIFSVEGHFPVSTIGTNSGPGGYITAYVPSGTEVVGAQIIDGAGTPISARPGTSAQSGEGADKGWGPIGTLTFATGINAWNLSPLPAACTAYGKTLATCMSGMAYIYGDTGVFYSTRSDTALYTGDGSNVIKLTNGYQTNPTNAAVWPDVGGTGNERVHNKWDAVQTNAFGSGAVVANPGFTVAEETQINTGGRGATPYLAGSPVAGPDSGLPLDRYAATGPWSRVSYPGSCIATSNTPLPATSAGGTGADPVTGVNSVSVCTVTSAGVSLNSGAPLPPLTNAVRFAVGGITLLPVAETHHVRLTLRVTNVAALGPVNIEGAGGDSTQGLKAGNDNPWRYWVGALAIPQDAATLAIKKSVVAVNGVPVSGQVLVRPGDKVRYRLTYANTWVTPQTNVLLKDTLPAKVSAVGNFTVVSGPNILPITPAAPTGGTTFSFTTIPSLGAGQGGVVEFDAQTTSVLGDVITNASSVQSTQVTTPVTSSVSFTVVAIANLGVTKSGPTYALPGSTLSYTITLSNAGPDAATSVSVTDTLPAGLSYVSSAPAAAVSGQTLSWTLASLSSGASQTYAVSALGPAAATLSSTPGTRSPVNSVTVSSAIPDSNPANNTASATTRMVYARLSKRVRNVSQASGFGVLGGGLPGERLEYCIDFANEGGADLPNFVLGDPVPLHTSADLSSYGVGFGVRLTRSVVSDLTSTSGDADGAHLDTALGVNLSTLLAGETGSACFRTVIR